MLWVIGIVSYTMDGSDLVIAVPNRLDEEYESFVQSVSICDSMTCEELLQSKMYDMEKRQQGNGVVTSGKSTDLKSIPHQICSKKRSDDSC